ncbi:NAD(P)/FAD-dependent oxidoreductase [Nocardia gipuzkoensis]|uniref:NAD(P)/FAD-dependent oxidoreductase n=1 Tax=Nocardia gipuzkoensis TaxID=2749991 RepID=UPI001E2CE675|nr:NAD(P)/FAD-dependent oxidoreductase [Nocardia gipuzkoensis]UGT67886.1 NAD(P)/FAD-dependent oxidoreductase [Nocardia gipuzkoensis]
MRPPGSIVIAGESIAGVTAARELRALGYTGSITIVGGDNDGAYARPPLSKAVLHDPAAEDTLQYRLDGADVNVVREPAVAADLDDRTVTTSTGRIVGYDALIAATGANARRLAAPGQSGELVLRTLADARLLRTRLATATSAIVIGAGFLGMEVATACVARGIPVTVVDVDPPLQRILGPFLSAAVTARAEQHGVQVVQTPHFVTLAGDPVCGVVMVEGQVLSADLVISCVGEIPNTAWLNGSGVADHLGIGIDDHCSTTVPGVYSAGDVAYRRFDGRRSPFWSNAVAQAKVAAASALGLPLRSTPTDDYFWTEILGLAIKIVGPLPVAGEPTVLEGSLADGAALLRWDAGAARSTVVAYGIRKPVPRLRAMANTLSG